MAEHSPGIWEIDAISDGGAWEVWAGPMDAGSPMICQCDGELSILDAEQSKANAHLIVAAPSLLAVAIKLRTAIDALRPFPLVVEPVAAALIAEADRAIAKAIPSTLREPTGATPAPDIHERGEP